MRITRKKENGFYKLKEGQEIYGEEDGIRLVQIVGKFEDLEEELGIGLTKLFEILKSENIYANGKRYDNSNSLSYMGNSWLIFNHQAKQGFRFKDYGKTWALTKEELE